MRDSIGSTTTAPSTPTPTPSAPTGQTRGVRVDFGSGSPNLYCSDCTGILLEQAVRSGDAKIGYDLQAQARGLDPARILRGSAEDKQVLADLAETLQRRMAQGAPHGDGIASNLAAFRAEAQATVALRPQAEDAPGLPTLSATGASTIPGAAGGRVLRDNPILEVEWRSTTSPVTNKSGFTRPLEQLLDAGGIRRDAPVLPRPLGGTTSNSPAAATQNGNAARDAIAESLRADPRYSEVQTEVRRQTSLGGRQVDVVATLRGERPEMNRRVEIESKLGRASASTDTRLQVAKDVERLTDNVKVRGFGSALEGVGKVARPIGVVVDAVQVGRAFQQDGNRVGDHTQRAVGSLAGGAAGAWGGAQLGAAIGSAGGPVGTLIGGAVGGIAGGVVGSGVGEKAVDWVKSWF